MKEFSVHPISGTLEADACARSSLNPKTAFQSIYCRNLSTLKPFYKALLGASTVRYEAEDLMVIQHADGSELVLQEVGETSAFSPLVGKQSIGVTYATDVALTLSKDAQAVDLGWDEETRTVADPEGNSILLVAVKDAKANLRKVG